MEHDNFLNQAAKIYGHKHMCVYVDLQKKPDEITMRCLEHGVFKRHPKEYLEGKGCPKCDEVQEWTAKANKIHKFKYSYAYVRNVRRKRVRVVCPNHGGFNISPTEHLNGKGCPKCEMPQKPLYYHKFIEKATKIHRGKYSYKMVTLNIKSGQKIPIVCPEHGVFRQVATEHLRGHGCPKCAFIYSSLESDVEWTLKNMGIRYQSQKMFPNMRYVGSLALDFYLPDLNVAIECQGEQHFRPIEYFGGEANFEKVSKRDAIKKEYCEQHGITLLYYTHCKNPPYPCITDLTVLEETLKNMC